MVLYLWIVPLSYGLQGVLRLAGYTLNVLNKALYSMALTLVQMFVLYIPLAYFGSSLMGLTGIFGAAAIAHTVAGLIAFWVLRQTVAAAERKLTPPFVVGVAAD